MKISHYFSLQGSQRFLRSRRGSALIIVLLFVILLTTVTIAFLSRSMTAIQVSSASANETKAGLLTNSAADIIIGDLKQEIIAGSSQITGVAGFNWPISISTPNWPVYVPQYIALGNYTMVPFQNGVPANNTIPNMISRSVSPANTGGTAPYVPYPAKYYQAAAIPPNRAANDSTAANTYTSSYVNSSYPSLNGRYVSPAEWNLHYLIPRQDEGSADFDSTPATSANFVPPDWVIVTRAGATSVNSANVSFASSSATAINNSLPTNTNYAIGRYAYAIYNEGGLLDMNVAGYPSAITANQASQKSSLAFADLTQAHGTLDKNTALTQAEIDQIVGWRNAQSLTYSPSGSTAIGSLGNLNLTAANGANWITNFAQAGTNFSLYTNNTGNMQVFTPETGAASPTDQAFTSRQQLISLLQSVGVTSADPLQYLGTFSRSLEQPSFVPDPGKPQILGTAPTSMAAFATYTGSNSVAGYDSKNAASSLSPNVVNPAFLSVRVQNAFTRLNGTEAIVGEPLVKYRFALSRLAMVAHGYSNTNLPPGFAATTADPDPIYDRFGLKWNTSSNSWTYYHGFTGIAYLTQVANLPATAAREPDFAELLKAVIVAGSLGKAGPNINNGYNYQYGQDFQVDVQVLQIMANLIDQQDTDSYPTSISLTNSFGTTTVNGIEDLPYFYRYHFVSVTDRAPSTIVPTNAAAITLGNGGTTTVTTNTATTWPAGAQQSATLATFTGPKTWTGCQILKGTVGDPGEATLLLVPEVWNPTDPNAALNEPANSRPTNFRIYYTTADPVSATPNCLVGAETTLSTTTNGGVKGTSTPTAIPALIPEYNTGQTIYNWPVSYTGGTAMASYKDSTTIDNTITFTDVQNRFFREPTLLWDPLDPNDTSAGGSGIQGPVVLDANTSKKYTGFILGKAPIQMQITSSTTGSIPGRPTNDGTYIVQGQTIEPLINQPSGSYPQFSIFLQYQDPTTSNWVTYDTKYADFHGITAPNIIDTTNDATSSSYDNPTLNNQWTGNATCMDPRTDRWGVGTNSTIMANGSSSSAPTYGPFLELNSTYGSNNDIPSWKYNTAANNALVLAQHFSVMTTNRPLADCGEQVAYSNPCNVGVTDGNLQMRWFGQNSYSGTAAAPKVEECDGLFAQNNSAISTVTLDQQGKVASQLYYEDPDGIDRLAMGGYALTTLNPGDPTIGVPTAPATNSYGQNSNVAGQGTATSQSQSRPEILNRPFNSVAEMSYAFRGTAYKNIDFMSPASGDTGLLDVFCLNEPPPSGIVAGKVDLNTRQAPVLQALESGAYRDFIYGLPAANGVKAPTYALTPINSDGKEATSLANSLISITNDFTDNWRGPLQNVAWLVGHYVPNSNGTSPATDEYGYAPVTPLATNETSGATFSGWSQALGYGTNGSSNTVYTVADATNNNTDSDWRIQRMREAAIRPLVSMGQVRVWNLLIDLVAQTGRYPNSATNLSQFVVTGQKHVWLHVAIDRLTGKVLDKQVEVINH